MRISRPDSSRLASRRLRYFFTTIDVAARKHPQSVSRFDRPADEHDLSAGGADDRADGNLGIEIDDLPARHADRPFRFGRLELAHLEATAAGRAEAVGNRFHL